MPQASRDDSLYSRQTSLTLRYYSSAIVVGCGGIGNWVALDLALSGCVENLYLIDPDVIEESNLNRTIFQYTDIGCFKVDAIARQIISRRPSQEVIIMHDYMSDYVADRFISTIFDNDNSYYHSDVVIVDCRDDIYEDCYKLNCKLYKVGYDGMDITIDGNPRLTKVFGQRGGSYSVTPSYIGSAQLAALLVCNDICYPKICRKVDKNEIQIDKYNQVLATCRCNENYPYLYDRVGYEFDELGRINDNVNISCTDIISNFVLDKHEFVIPDKNFSNLPKTQETKEETNVD